MTTKQIPLRSPFTKYFVLVFLFFSLGIKAVENDTVSFRYRELKLNSDKLDFLYHLSTDAIYKIKSANKSFLRNEINSIKLLNDKENGIAALIKGNIIYFEDSVALIKSYFLKSFNILKNYPQNKYYGFSIKALSAIYYDLGIKDSTIYYCALGLQNALKNKTDVSEAYYNLGSQYYFFSNINDAIINLEKSAETGILLKDYKNTALAFKILSVIYRDQKTFDYMALCDTSLYYAYKTKDNVQITEALYYKIQCLILQDKTKEALSYLNISKSIFAKDPGNLYLEINFNRAAAFYYSEIADVDKTLFHLQKTNLLLNGISRVSGRTGRGYNNIGNACLSAKQYKLAINYLDTAIYFGEKYNDQALLWFAY
ncbi:MAG TPA: hypothetical protein VGF30_01365, partial [Bacteroidia bacterium]